MPFYDATVELEISPGETPQTAEVEPEDVKKYHFDRIFSLAPAMAKNRALDQFHDMVPIGVLDRVEITAKAKLSEQGASCRPT